MSAELDLASKQIDPNLNGDDDDLEEDIEPKLSYERLRNDLDRVLKGDAASCIAVHAKFIALGTHLGKIVIFDHQGNNIQSCEISLHTTSVNQISIDEKGEYFASCSVERAVITGLYTTEHNVIQTFNRPVRAIAIDPFFFKHGQYRRFITGTDEVVLHEKSYFFRDKTTILQQGDGPTRNIRWYRQFIAWASDQSVRIYDIEEKTVITLIKRDHSLRPDLYRCNLYWKDEKTLYIGWADIVKICNIKIRNFNESQQQPRAVADTLPKRYVELSSVLTMDFIVCGISSIDNHLVALTINKDFKNVTSTRPQLQIIEVDGDEHFELSGDILNLRNFHEYLYNDYHLESLKEDGVYFIICPSDVVIAKPREEDDHVSWLLAKKKYEEAIEAVKKGRSLRKHSLISVGREYINYLLEQNEQSSSVKAAKICSLILGRVDKTVNVKTIWEEEVIRFKNNNQLRTLTPLLPIGIEPLPITLDPSIYEMALNDFLIHDPEGFLSLIRKWPSNIYSTQVLVTALMKFLTYNPKNEILLEALAELYSQEGKHDKALTIYLEIGNKTRVFDLIRKFQLLNTLKEKLELFMNLNAVEASRLLFEHVEEIPVDYVVEKLRNRPSLLWTYLDRVIQKDAELCAPYHELVVELYAEYCSQRLMPFLKISNQYSLEKALNICRKKSLVPEIVFLLGRMGNTKDALHYITESLEDIDYAIEFCKEHSDSELWEDLISYSLKKPCFIRVLLQNIGTHIPDPISLVHRIPENLEIEGLMPALVQILHDYNLQISLEEGCKRVLVSDYYKLLKKLNDQQRESVSVRDSSLCQGCHMSVFAREIKNASDIVVFNCKHSFHENCLPTQATSGEFMCTSCLNKKEQN